MTEMDRPDGLQWMRVAAGVGLALLFLLAGFAGTFALFFLTSFDMAHPLLGDIVIAGLLTLALLIAVIARRRRRAAVRMWLLAILAGLTCGAWITAFHMGGLFGV